MKPLEAREDRMRGPSVDEILRSPDEVSPQGLRILSWMAYNVGDFVPTEDICRIVAPQAKIITPDIVDMTRVSISHIRAYLNEEQWGLYSLQSPGGYFLVPQVVRQENENRIVHLGNFRPIPDWITDKTSDHNELTMLCRTTQIVRIGTGVRARQLLPEFLYTQLLRLMHAHTLDAVLPYGDISDRYWSMIRGFLYRYDKVWDLRRTGDTIQLVKRE